MSRARGFCAAKRTLDIASSSPTMIWESEGNLTRVASCFRANNQFDSTSVSTTAFLIR